MAMTMISRGASENSVKYAIAAPRLRASCSMKPETVVLPLRDSGVGRLAALPRSRTERGRCPECLPGYAGGGGREQSQPGRLTIHALGLKEEHWQAFRRGTCQRLSLDGRASCRSHPGIALTRVTNPLSI